MEPKISLITLGVADVDRSVRFYRDGLGWHMSSASVPGQVAFFRLGGVVLALWGRAALAGDARLPHDEGWGSVALAHNVASREAVDQAVEAWSTAGGAVLKAPVETEWGGYSGYVADPDGHPWELAWNPAWPLADDGSVTLPD